MGATGLFFQEFLEGLERPPLCQIFNPLSEWQQQGILRYPAQKRQKQRDAPSQEPAPCPFLLMSRSQLSIPSLRQLLLDFFEGGLDIF